MAPKRKSPVATEDAAKDGVESNGAVKKVKQQGLDAFFKAEPKAKAKAKTASKQQEDKQASGESETHAPPASEAPAAAPAPSCSSSEDGVPDWAGELGAGWHEALKGELCKPYLVDCLKKVKQERTSKKVYPPEELVFNAFRTTPLERVKVVIVGQDPYHQPGQAMGLCFSVMRGVAPPPSLKNMYKEIGITCSHGDLSHWAQQGVFMLNALLTVQESTPMAHKSLGWDKFTDAVIQTINDKCEGVVFLLWGKPAQKKGAKVNRTKHHVLEAGHPSPLSVRHFMGCGHFTKTNEILTKAGKEPIDWKLPA
eukprot:GDKI01048803.1.p1 GENE.GDKI01048803.1~~GDKI01048803.1.p1  ORF type:complete len:310 (-),score=105.86 GDKI01048803.1:33-962(-)